MQFKKYPVSAKAVFLLAAFTLAPLANAHYLWIEPDKAGSAKLYFGEYQEGLREKAGGRLD